MIDHEFDTVLRRYVTSVILKFQRHLKEEWAVSRCVQASHFTTERYDFAFSYAMIYSLLSHLTPARTFRQQLECQVPIKNNFGKFELFEPLVTLKIASSLIIQLFTTHTCFYTRLLLNRPHTLKSTMSTSGVWNQLAPVVKDNDSAQFIFKRLYKCPRLLNEHYKRDFKSVLTSKCEPKQWFLLIYRMNLGLIRAN